MNVAKVIVVTIIAGYLGTCTLGNMLNWPDAGAIVSVCVMGGFLLRKMQQNKDNNTQD